MVTWELEKHAFCHFFLADTDGNLTNKKEMVLGSLAPVKREMLFWLLPVLEFSTQFLVHKKYFEVRAFFKIMPIWYFLCVRHMGN